MYRFTDRANYLGSGIFFPFLVDLPLSCFTFENLLLPKIKVGTQLFRAKSNLY